MSAPQNNCCTNPLVNTTPCVGGDPCSTQLLPTDVVSYSGPNLPCTGINTCDTATVALQKADEQICELKEQILILQQILQNCCTTTTSTTTAPTTSTTSSSTSTTSSTSSTSSTTSTSSSTSTTSSTSSTSSTTSTTSSTSSTSSTTSTSSSTTTTTTTCFCRETVTLNITVEGSVTYEDCCGVANSLNLLVGEYILNCDSCINVGTLGGTAEYTIMSYGPCCTPVCTTTTTSSTSTTSSTTSTTSSSSSTTTTTTTGF